MTKSEKVSIIEVVRGCVKGFYSERYMVNKCHEEVASDFRLRGALQREIWCFFVLRGYPMNQLDKNIAANLKRIRKSKNLSLDALSEKTGVSKSMLGQIERGESNPTVATIAKIVDGIRISFEELLYPRQEEILIIDNDKMPLLRAEEGAYQVRLVFPHDRHRNFEVYEMKIEPGGGCTCFWQEENSSEYILVVQGVLTLKTTDGTYEVAANHAVKLDAAREHSYHNSGSRQLILNLFAPYHATGAS